MRFKEALEKIAAFRPTGGFRVQFEEKDRELLKSDMFPSREEFPIPTEEQAWEFARIFSRENEWQYVNIYVIEADTYLPVKKYEEKILNKYPKEDLNG